MSHTGIRGAQTRAMYVSPADFGAAGNGTTDDTEAVLRTINEAVRNGYDRPVPVYFPPGQVLVTENNVFGQWDSINTSVRKGVFGLTFIGAGMRSSEIVLKQTSNDTDLYFYDNKTPGQETATNNSLLFPTFRDIGFGRTGAGTALVHGFRLYGTANGYPSQHPAFYSCHFDTLGTVLACQGVQNTDSSVFVGCRGLRCDTFLDIANVQSVVHNILGCNFELAKSDVFRFTSGGSLKVVAGSYMMHADAAVAHYILSSIAPAGGITGQFAIEGIRCEMNSVNARIMNIQGTNNAAHYYLARSAFRTQVGGPRVGFNFASNSKFLAEITGNEFLSNYTINWEAGTPPSAPAAKAWLNHNWGLGQNEVAWASPPGGTVVITNDHRGESDFTGDGS